jgi:putative NADPH-quinone reductase
MLKILIIKAHPNQNSFCNALGKKYLEGAKKRGHQVKTLDLVELNLEKFIKFTHQDSYNLSKDLLKSQELITWANHLVFIYPTWWAGPPSLLKVFFEMVFHSGFAFKYKKSKGFVPKWDKLLFNKSARIIVTMDSPPFYYKYIAGDPGYKTLKDILNFCGINPVYKNYFGSVKMSSENKRKKWLEKVYNIGLNEN